MIYLAPMKKWVVDVLENREKNPNMSNTKMPFVIMSSAAKIVKHTAQQTREEVLSSMQEVVEGKGVVEHLGCIISNHIDPNINYSHANPYVGYDFNGKLITVNGEAGRKISPPIIESVDIDTNGVGNTLKEARIRVRCFSLKQYEMFELFFCKPAMHILLEYGDNSMSSVLNDVMVSKSKYSDFIGTFKEFTNPTTKQFAEYLKKCKISNGSYDRVAGMLINYSYSIDSDSTYNVELTIAQSNEYSLALPHAFVVNYSAVSTPNNKNMDTFEEWQNQIIHDLPGLNADYIKSLKKDVWKKDFFNWGKSDETDIEKAASNDPYISLRFLLDILMNNIISEGEVSKDFKFQLPYRFKKKGGESILPFNVHKNIISASPSIIFPNKELPKFNLNPKNNTIEIDTKSTTDGSINGYTLFDNDAFDYIDPLNDIIKIQQLTTDFRIGNALNIFIRYKDIGELWEKNYSRKDFLVDILDKINEASYGTFRLIYANINEGDSASVIDSKLYAAELTSSKLNEQASFRKQYRFKPTTINSNVREFTFNFELTNQVAAATVFNTGAYLATIKNKTKTNKLPIPNSVYQSIDYSSFSTADGLYAINQIQYDQIKQVTNAAPPNKNSKQDDSFEAEVVKTAHNLKQIKFKIKKGDIRPFIYLDYAFILKKLGLSDDNRVKNTYELVTPITINVKIDGISGITCGETFKIDGIPEQYNRLGDFQITNTKHNIDKDNGWTTTLEAMFMYGS